MPRRAARPTLDCEASAATSAGGGELVAVRGEHALGQEVPGESSGRRVWPWRAWLGCRSRLRRWLPARRSAARPHSGHRRLPGRPRLPRPHQRPAATGRHAAWPAAQPSGARQPPRPGFPPGSPRQAPRNAGRGEPPVARPEDPTPFSPGGRPRPRPGRGQPDGRGPANERPRPQAASRVRPTVEETMMSNGRRVPPSGVPTPPRGPRAEGFRGRGADYDQMAAGPQATAQADGSPDGQARRAVRTGPPTRRTDKPVRPEATGGHRPDGQARVRPPTGR